MAANINTEFLLVFECFSTVCRAEASEAFKTDRNMMEDGDAWRFLFCFGFFLDWLVRLMMGVHERNNPWLSILPVTHLQEQRSEGQIIRETRRGRSCVLGLQDEKERKRGVD